MLQFHMAFQITTVPAWQLCHHWQIILYMAGSSKVTYYTFEGIKHVTLPLDISFYTILVRLVSITIPILHLHSTACLTPLRKVMAKRSYRKA